MDVALTLPQGRNGYRYGIKTVVQVLAEPAVADGMLEIDVGGCDYADIGFLRFGRAYADEFSGFQNSQQAGLGGKRQLADLVQEYGALVRSLEISLTRLIGSGKRAFLMSEELGLDGALGDRSAVDGDVVVVLAGAVSMYRFLISLSSMSAKLSFFVVKTQIIIIFAFTLD